MSDMIPPADERAMIYGAGFCSGLIGGIICQLTAVLARPEDSPLGMSHMHIELARIMAEAIQKHLTPPPQIVKEKGNGI